MISQTLDLVLENVKLQENVNPQRVTTLKGPNIESIERVEKFKICRHCSKRIIQVTQKIVNSDYCHHKLRAPACATKLSISLVVNHEDNKLYLTIREDPLQEFPTRIPYKNSLQKFPTRIPYKNSLQEFPTRIPYKNSLQEFPTRIPFKNSLHLCSLQCR